MFVSRKMVSRRYPWVTSKVAGAHHAHGVVIRENKNEIFNIRLGLNAISTANYSIVKRPAPLPEFKSLQPNRLSNRTAGFAAAAKIIRKRLKIVALRPNYPLIFGTLYCLFHTLGASSLA